MYQSQTSWYIALVSHPKQTEQLKLLSFKKKEMQSSQSPKSQFNMVLMTEARRLVHVLQVYQPDNLHTAFLSSMV